MSESLDLEHLARLAENASEGADWHEWTQRINELGRFTARRSFIDALSPDVVKAWLVRDRALVTALPDPEKLEAIADALDLTSKCVVHYMDIAEKLDTDGKRASAEYERVREWARGDEMQRDLRAWADLARGFLSDAQDEPR